MTKSGTAPGEKGLKVETEGGLDRELFAGAATGEGSPVADGCGELSLLLGPISFAVKNDFSGLDRVRGIEALIRAKVEAARRRGGIDTKLLEAVLEPACGLDDLDPKRKKAALIELIAALGACIELPPALRSAAAARESSCSDLGDSRGGGPQFSVPAVEANEQHESSIEHVRAVEHSTAPADTGDERASRRGLKGAGSGGEASRSTVSSAEGRAQSDDPVLDAPISTLSGIGPSRAKAFAARGVCTLRDALWFLPVSYERRMRVGCIADLRPGVRATLRARVVNSGERALGRRRRVFEVLVADDTGWLRVRYYHAGAWLTRKFPEGATVGLSGSVRLARDRVLEMAHPDLVDPADADTGDSDDPSDSIVPRYSEVEGVPPRTVREIIGRVLRHAERLTDPLPPEMIERRRLVSPGEALTELHRPEAGASIEVLDNHATCGHQRLVYEELFFLQLGLALKARGVKVEAGIAFSISDRDIEAALALLPFSATGAQLRAVLEISRDMCEAGPMHRLLQGDVGSGKTAVAAVALILAARAGWQGAVMAPTELLAEQHHRTLLALLAPAGIEVALLSGRLRATQRREALAGLADGTVAVAVGTHALIQQGVEFSRLGLVVVDEQHRFGVRQRASLIEKGRRPDTLVMTATPIPRTLAMTAYGDLDLSIIDELPPGRTPVTTKVFRAKERDKVWEKVRSHVGEGRQAFVVYPIVETSEHLEDVRAATEMAEQLDREVFPELRVGLIHGKMAGAEKDEVMGAFSRGEIGVLVATTVVEVGIDVPNATVMVVEHAERFGLSQLHQLRGRVGRGAARSYCYLIAHEVRGEKVRDRLAVMARTCDGFLIAEEDLRIRGPGEVLGTRQSGHPDLLFGNLARDRAILAQAREDAFELVERDPDLRSPENRSAAREVLARWGGRIQLGRVG